MDPAAGVSSPFHNEVAGRNGPLENVLEGLEMRANGPDIVGRYEGGEPKNARQREGDSVRRGGTPCAGCGLAYTMSTVPSGGVYLCAECVTQQREKSKVNRFSPNTLRCCPASVTEGGDAVIRCCACLGWYHCACLDIHDGALKEYLSLSTTRWYCPEPSCCERILQERLKRKR